jgi:hypothetical protein
MAHEQSGSRSFLRLAILALVAAVLIVVLIGTAQYWSFWG